MITRKDYKLQGSFTYYEYKEIERRSNLYEKLRITLNSKEDTMLELGSVDIAHNILSKYAEEDGYLEPQIIEDLNIKKEIAEFTSEYFKNVLKWQDEEIETYFNLYNKYPHMLYLQVSVEILIIIHDMLYMKKNNIYIA